MDLFWSRTSSTSYTGIYIANILATQFYYEDDTLPLDGSNIICLFTDE
jgi:hypothetical protein